MFKRFSAIGALLGLVIPGVLLLKMRVTNVPFGILDVMAWPSSIGLMANELLKEGDPMIWVNMAQSVLLNMIWYVVLAMIAFLIFRAFRWVIREWP